MTTLTEDPVLSAGADDAGPYRCCKCCTDHEITDDHESPCPNGCAGLAVTRSAAVPDAAPEVPADWMAALKFFATGRTAQALRDQADDPAWVAGLAYIDGATPEEYRAGMLAIAGAIDVLAAEGMTPERCYFLAGLDRTLGPYEDNALLSAA